jgi:hypothetical protein
MPIISALRRGRQEDLEFQDSLGYLVKLCLKKPKQQCTHLLAQFCKSEVRTGCAGCFARPHKVKTLVKAKVVIHP